MEMPIISTHSSQYRIGKLIGRGAESLVFEGFDDKNKKVAIKQISVTKNSESHLFETEVSLLCNLDSKHILKLLGVAKEKF
jgi:serine/threonine protein kinase